MASNEQLQQQRLEGNLQRFVLFRSLYSARISRVMVTRLSPYYGVGFVTVFFARWLFTRRAVFFVRPGNPA
jgi:hypothetical protein